MVLPNPRKDASLGFSGTGSNLEKSRHTHLRKSMAKRSRGANHESNQNKENIGDRAGYTPHRPGIRKHASKSGLTGLNPCGKPLPDRPCKSKGRKQGMSACSHLAQRHATWSALTALSPVLLSAALHQCCTVAVVHQCNWRGITMLLHHRY